MLLLLETLSITDDAHEPVANNSQALKGTVYHLYNNVHIF